VKRLEYKAIFFKIIALFISADCLQASSGGTPEINWWGLGGRYSEAPAMGWLLVTFGIFVWVMARIIKKPLGLYLESRSQDIRRAVEEGHKAKLESEQKLKSYEEKLKSLDSEIAKMKTAFAEQAEAERILKAQITKESGARILKDTEDTIKAEFERSKNRLAEEVITSALHQAQQRIVQNYLPEVDSYLKHSLINDIKNSTKEGLKP
jgi:F0F1-type ATP synthase membrane subunit b/b'